MSSDNYFNIFNTPKSHSKWDKHIEFASSHTDEPENRKIMWVEALNFLRIEFGNDFLAANTKQRNQFAELMKGKAPWQVSELIKTAAAFQFLKSYDSNYLKLLQKLKGSKLDVAEGMSFLEVTMLFMQNGFKIKFLDEIKTEATPDIELQSEVSKETIFVEISELNNSQSRENLQENYYALYNVWEAPGIWLPYSCSLKQFMGEKQLQAITHYIKKAKRDAETNKSIIDFENDYIRFSVAHPSKHEELMAFIDKHDYRNGLHGAPLDFDETERLCSNKLKQKAKQIPLGSTGIIFISVNPLYFMVTDMSKVIDRFVQRMEVHKNIFGTILFGTILNSDTEVFEEEFGHVIRLKKVENALSKYIIFIKNHHCDIELKLKTQENIYLSLKQ